MDYKQTERLMVSVIGYFICAVRLPFSFSKGVILPENVLLFVPRFHCIQLNDNKQLSTLNESFDAPSAEVTGP